VVTSIRLVRGEGRGKARRNSHLCKTTSLVGKSASGLALRTRTWVLGTSSNGRKLTDAELDKWVASFPIEAFQTGWPRVVLPADIHS
jgi:hypothetical protein